MDPRTHRALAIAATTLLAPKDNGRWVVPSQSGSGTYRVGVTRDGSWHCTCPDFEERLDRCKHILAVEITERRKAKRKPEPYTEPEPPVTYRQNWPLYNKAQCNEKDMVLRLLADLCSTVPQPIQQGRGCRYLPISDVLFALVFRTYTGLSARRFQSDLRAAADAGFIDTVPDFSSVLRYLGREELTPILVGLVELSAYPLRAVETDFAVDSSGFGTTNLYSWFSVKHGRTIDSRVWRKCHLMCGVKTNVVTAVSVTGAFSNDAPHLPELVRTTAKGGFTLAEVSADKGYSSKSNAATIEDAGAQPFIAFKGNTVEPKPGSAWARMHHRFAYETDAFLAAYHKRSDVETTFHMIKAKFGDHLRGKTDTSQDNEVLTKVIAHNLCRLVHAFYELGIEADFDRATRSTD
jgi:transposase